jgi:hypothetical protein
MPWVKKIVPASTNNLTQAIINFLNHEGHFAMRINTEGQFEEANPMSYNWRLVSHHVQALRAFRMVVGTWRKIPDDEKGKADIFFILAPKGLFGAVEIKFGDDKRSKFQVEWQAKAKKAGAILLEECDKYGQFIEWYDKTVKPLI